MKQPGLLLLMLLSFLATSGQEKKNVIDHSNLESIINAIFLAAKTNNPKLLKDLCPPTQENDGDTDCLCALYEEYKPHQCESNSHNRLSWKEFVDYFSNGSIAGDGLVEENRAEVPILFGPEGNRKETINLVKISGIWYLLSF